MRLPHRTRWAVVGLSAMGMLALSSPALAATTTPLTYTVTVSGSWSGQWTVGPGHSSYRASRAPVPYNKSWTPTGDITVTFPPLPAGDHYWDSGSMHNPGLYSNAWCGEQGAAWPQYSIPTTGGSYSEPLATIWGTMWAMTSTPAACVIDIAPPEIANASGALTKAQFGGLYLSLPVQVDQPPQPKPKPSTPTQPAPTHSGSSGSSGQGGGSGGGTTQPHAPTNPPRSTGTSTTTGTTIPGNVPPSQNVTPTPNGQHPAPATTTTTPSHQHGKGVPTRHQPKHHEGKKIKSRPVHPAHGTLKSQAVVPGQLGGQHPQSRSPSHFAGFPWWLLLLLLLAAATLIGWLMRHRQRRRAAREEEPKDAGEEQKEKESQEGHESPEDEG